MSEQSRDGRFYAKNGTVWRSPKETKTETGVRISLGFAVCQPSDALGDDGAETLAAIFNDAIDKGIIND
jgi:hypothetical protein